MTNPVIPAEAVEAAAKALALKSYNKEFDAMDDHTQNFLRDNARFALEAAAPYITGAAWEEGYGHGYKHGYADCLKLHGHETKEEA